MIRAVHGGPNEVAEPGVHHDELVARAFGIAARALDVVNPAHQDGHAGDCVATRLDLHPNRASGGPGQAIDRVLQHRPVPGKIVCRLVRPVGVRDASAEIHRVRVGESGQDGLEEVHQFAHVLVELARLRASPDVRVQSHDGEPGGSSGLPQLFEILVPHSVLGGRAAGVAGLHMAVPKARVGPHGDRAAVSGLGKLPDHARRSQVGQDVMLLQHFQGIVAEHVGGEHDPGRFSPAGKAGAHRA